MAEGIGTFGSSFNGLTSAHFSGGVIPSSEFAKNNPFTMNIANAILAHVTIYNSSSKMYFNILIPRNSSFVGFNSCTCSLQDDLLTIVPSTNYVHTIWGNWVAII